MLSAGGDDKELARHGLGMEHVNEVMVRMSRQLLQSGHRLAYGGTLGVEKEELTENLIDAALGWLDTASAQQGVGAVGDREARNEHEPGEDQVQVPREQDEPCDDQADGRQDAEW